MIKYIPELTDVVLEEIPDKVTLAVEISNCRGSCPGCHSPFLKRDIGEELTPAIVEKISSEKGDPEWMREFRLKSLEIYNQLLIPEWGPPIDGLNMDNIATYVKPKTKMHAEWDEVPDEIKDMEPVASHWQEHDKLGEALIKGLGARNCKIYQGRIDPMELTQTCYSTIPAALVELGNGASAHDDAALEKLADGLADGLEVFLKEHIEK